MLSHFTTAARDGGEASTRLPAGMVSPPALRLLPQPPAFGASWCKAGVNQVQIGCKSGVNQV